MSRKSTLPRDWEKLKDAVGTINDLCELLEVSQSTVYRIARGQVEATPEMRDRIGVLCDIHEVANPLDTAPKAFARDLVPLRLFGDALARGLPTASRTVARLRSIYPTEQLIKLAEGESTPDAILRAVQALLEDA